jgi:very-short-patch-repair endonuclease
MLVFASFEPSIIDLSRVSHQGVKDLKAYLDFARRGPVAIVEEVKFNPDTDDFDSDFERSVAEGLRRKNWEVKTQIGVSKFRIDLGVVNPDAPGLFLAGIECDGASYHSSPSARDRDRVRHLILEGLNWKLLRIWSTDYFANKVKIIDEINRRLNELLDDYRQKIAEEKSKSEEESETAPKHGISQENEDHDSAEESADLPELNVQDEDNESINNQDSYVEDSDIVEQPFLYYSGPPCKDPHKCDESEVKDRLLDIITDEGPMFIDCAYKTYLRSAGISKLGRQLRRILNKNLESLIRRGDIEEIKESDGEGFKGSVVRRKGTPAVILRASGNRKIEDIPPSEFRMLARKKYVKTPPSSADFYRQLVKFYGVSKLTAKSTEILDKIFKG